MPFLKQMKRAAELQALREPESKYAKVAAALPELEAALKAGKSRETCRLFMKSLGVDLSPDTFKNYLYRARLEDRLRPKPAEPIAARGIATELHPAAPSLSPGSVSELRTVSKDGTSTSVVSIHEGVKMVHTEKPQRLFVSVPDDSELI